MYRITEGDIILDQIYLNHHGGNQKTLWTSSIYALHHIPMLQDIQTYMKKLAKEYKRDTETMNNKFAKAVTDYNTESVKDGDTIHYTD